jgi:hypothetical protein
LLGHLPKRIEEYRKRLKTLSVTFITFSPDGKELLVNLGGEQLYTFDLMSNKNQNIKYDSFRELFANFPDLEQTASSTSEPNEAESNKK